VADRLREVARWSGLSRAELSRYQELEVIVIGDRELSPALLRRLRRIRRLRRDLGLDVEAVAIIVRLLDRIEELERRSSA
jgi:DNA-binding transcriptional MerR regulator